MTTREELMDPRFANVHGRIDDMRREADENRRSRATRRASSRPSRIRRMIGEGLVAMGRAILGEGRPRPAAASR
jgi:hypothetical protein